MTVSKQLIERCITFDGGTNADVFSNTGTNSTRDSSGVNGASIVLGTAANNGRFSFGDNLSLDIDQLHYVEFRAKVEAMDDTVYFFLGVGAAGASDLNTVAQRCFFRIGAASADPGGYDIIVNTDDGTTDTTVNTGLHMPNSTWKRFRLDFQSGIQAISVPGSSKAGKSNIKWSVTDDRLGYQSTLNNPSSYLDMSAYSGGLQVIFGGQSASVSDAGELYVHSVKWAYEAPS